MAGCFCLGRPTSPGAEAVQPKAAPSDLPLKAFKYQIQPQDSKPADVLIGAVKAVQAGEPVSSEQQQKPDGASIEATALDLGPLRELPTAAPDGGGADDEEQSAELLADEPARKAGATETAVASQAKLGAADGKTAGQPEALIGAAAPDSSGAAGDHDQQVAASLASQLHIKSNQGNQAGPFNAVQASTAVAGRRSEATDHPQLNHASSKQPEAGAKSARANVEGTAHSTTDLDQHSSIEQIKCLEQETSSTALLPASEVSPKQPLMSQLSAPLSCGSQSPYVSHGEKPGKQKTPKVPLPQQPQHLQLDFDAAAADLVLLPPAKLLPLPQPARALADAARLLGRQDTPTLLAALLTLRRVAIHHGGLLAGSLADLAALLVECMHGKDAALAQAAVMALLDLLFSHGSAMLSCCEHSSDPQRSCLLALLLAASTGRTPAIRHWANEALRFMAEQLQRGRVVRMLEPYLEHPHGPVRSKAAEWLMVATYRPAERGGRGSPRGSPGLCKPGWKD